MKALIGAMLMTSAACAQVPQGEAEPAVPEPAVPEHGGGGNCDSAPAQKLVGRARSEHAGAEALRLSGARVLRWIPEGTMVTMDYREDRLSIHLDAQNKIARIICG